MGMKFAAIALIATASAVEIRAEKWCVDKKESHEIFAAIDTNHNGQIGKHELVHALKEFAHHEDHKITDKEWAWVKKTATKDAGKDKHLNEKEFHKWINQFANHFHLCHK